MLYIHNVCVQQIASGKLLYGTGGSAWCPVMTQRHGTGSEQGQEGGSRGRGYMYMYNWFTLLYSRNTTLESNYTRVIIIRTLAPCGGWTKVGLEKAG